jgi:superfamily II DNA helicase RecQ
LKEREPDYKVTAYHAGVSQRERYVPAVIVASNTHPPPRMPNFLSLNSVPRSDSLARFTAGGPDIIVATVSFGIGVDCSHVCCVVNYRLPFSV